MTFSFRIFRVLTSINLFLAGFFLMMLLMALLSGAVQVLAFLFLIGAVFIHSVLSLYLQKSLMDKSISLKESTPTGIWIMGSFALIYAGLLLYSCYYVQAQHDKIVADMWTQMGQLTAEQRKQITPAILNSTINVIIGFFGIFGLMIIGNTLLSFNFLNKWNKRGDTTDIDINLES